MEASLKEQLQKLEEKYEAMGQDLSSYLDGLLHSDYLTYWDYIHLDTLLSLQSPRTAFPDEKIFILYHQITELYFRMILNELDQICFTDKPETQLFAKRIKRIIGYFDHLISSFAVMIDGMDKEQFLAFRMALLPSSGFQSGQYRKIEIMCTDFSQLIDARKTCELDPSSQDIESMSEHLYWKSGATELATGKKTLTLRQFEAKYDHELIDLAEKVKSVNIRKKFNQYFIGQKEIRELLRSLDYKVNIEWPLQHLKAASSYLHKATKTIEATGGTNWQKYLPPLQQKIIYYPEIWSSREQQEWGKPFNLTK